MFPSRIVLSALVLCLLGQASAVCYLEDTSSTCSVCWVTAYSSADDKVGVTRMTQCPHNIKAAYDTALPHDMFEATEYPVTFSLQIDPASTAVTPSKLDNGDVVEVPHANIHSCIASRGACTPFVANTPGLSTHTPALTGDFEAGKATFEGSVKLDMDTYIIIAHIRFYTPTAEAHGKPEKYDVAVGVQREVLKTVNEVGTDAYIMAGVVGFMILLFGGVVFYMVKKGILDLDRIMAALFSDYVTLPTDIVCGMADAATFTISCTLVLEDQNLLSVVPICWLFCGIAWAVSSHNMVHDLLYMKMMYDKHYNAEKYHKTMMLRMSSKFVSRRKSISADLNNAGKKKMARRLSNELESRADDSEEHRNAIYAFDMADRDFARRRRTIASILLESVPITILQTYILIVGEGGTGGTIAVLALLLAALLLGCKLQGLGDYGHAKERRGQALLHFDMLFHSNLKQQAMSHSDLRVSHPAAANDPNIPSPLPVRVSAEPTPTGIPIETVPRRSAEEETAVVVMDYEAATQAERLQPGEAQAAASNFGWTADMGPGTADMGPGRAEPDLQPAPAALPLPGTPAR